MNSFFFKLDAPCKLDSIHQASVLCAITAKLQPMQECVLLPHEELQTMRLMLNVREKKCSFLTPLPGYLRILLLPLYLNTCHGSHMLSFQKDFYKEFHST